MKMGLMLAAFCWLLVIAGFVAGRATGAVQNHYAAGSATCEAATYNLSAFPAGTSVRADVAVTFADHTKDFSRTVIETVSGSRTLIVPLGIQGNAVVDGYIEWTQNGRLVSSRVISQFVGPCNVAPTPTPAPTPVTPEVTPQPVPTPVVNLPEFLPTFTPGPDHPPTIKRVPRKVTCKQFRARYPKAGPRAYTKRGWYPRCKPMPKSQIRRNVAVAGELSPRAVTGGGSSIAVFNPQLVSRGTFVRTGATITRVGPRYSAALRITLFYVKPGTSQGVPVSTRVVNVSESNPSQTIFTLSACKRGPAALWFAAAAANSKSNRVSRTVPLRHVSQSVRLRCRP